MFLTCESKPVMKIVHFYTKIKNWFVGDLLSATPDFYEKAKIELNFNFPFFTFLLFVAFSIFLFLFNVEYSSITVTGAWLFALGFLFFLKYSKNIRLSSFLLSTVIFLLVTLNLLLNKQILHLGYPYWMSMQLLFAVFNLGIIWGVFYASFGALAFIIYRQFNLFDSMELINFDPKPHMITFIVEIALASFLLLYLIYLYLQTSRKSESALKTQNQLLTEKNALIESQNDEKTIMLREIHHRVKNNLQVVNSLLRLQSHEIKDKNSLKAFTISQQRIHAMALIHERLYQQDNLSAEISPNYIEILVHDLIDLYKNNQDISLTIHFCNGFINQKNVVPFGLIVNELVSNTLKHGIEQKGVISIEAERKNDTILFEYCDSGKGLDPNYHKGFGLELIESLADQIDGKVTYENKIDKGLQFNFVFNLKKDIKLN